MAPASAKASAHETTRRIEDSPSHPRQPEFGGAWLLQPLDTNSLLSQWPFFPSLSVSYHPTRWDGEPGHPERRLCPDGIGTKKRGSTAARPIRAQHHQPVCHQCAQPRVNLAHTKKRPSEKNRITEPFSCGGRTRPIVEAAGVICGGASPHPRWSRGWAGQVRSDPVSPLGSNPTGSAAKPYRARLPGRSLRSRPAIPAASRHRGPRKATRPSHLEVAGPCWWRRRESNRIPPVVRRTCNILSLNHLTDTVHGSVTFGVTS